MREQVDAVWHRATNDKAAKHTKKKRPHDVFLDVMCELVGVELTGTQRTRRKAVIDRVEALLTKETIPTTSPLPPLPSSPPRRRSPRQSPRRSPRRGLAGTPSPLPPLPPLQ